MAVLAITIILVYTARSLLVLVALLRLTRVCVEIVRVWVGLLDLHPTCTPGKKACFDQTIRVAAWAGFEPSPLSQPSTLDASPAEPGVRDFAFLPILTSPF